MRGVIVAVDLTLSLVTIFVGVLVFTGRHTLPAWLVGSMVIVIGIRHIVDRLTDEENR